MPDFLRQLSLPPWLPISLLSLFSSLLSPVITADGAATELSLQACYCRFASFSRFQLAFSPSPCILPLISSLYVAATLLAPPLPLRHCSPLRFRCH